MGAHKWFRVINTLVIHTASLLSLSLRGTKCRSNLGVSGTVRRGDCFATLAMTNWIHPLNDMYFTLGSLEHRLKALLER
jgi:hypothetical protein